MIFGLQPKSANLADPTIKKQIVALEFDSSFGSLFSLNKQT